MLTFTLVAHQARFQPLPDSLTPFEMSPGKEGEVPGTSPALPSAQVPPLAPKPLPCPLPASSAHGALLLIAAERGEGRCAQPKLGAR